MDIYNENLKYISENYPYIEWDAEWIQELKEKDERRIAFSRNSREEIIVEIEEKEHVWSLGSRYNAEQAAQYWVDGFENVNYRTIFVVLGIGSGIYLKKLREKYPENYVILHERDTVLLNMLMEVEKLESVLAEKVFLAAGKTASGLYTELVHKLLNYDNMREAKFVCVPNYEITHQMECMEARRHFMNRVERMILSRNTVIVDEEIRAKNTLPNLFWYPTCYSLGQLKDCVKDCEIEKRAAIIVSAGPSLDKNVKELRRAKNKAFIIVVDTALKTVLNAGVEPDLAVLIDPAKDPALFEREELLRIPLCTSVFANRAILEKHTGKKFFATRDIDWTAEIAKKYGKDMYAMHSGGSVANNAFSVAGIMGFQRFILVGQDLAYPNGKVHSADAYENEEDIVMSSKYFEVEDVYGEKVYTEANMDSYRRWFEETITFNPDCHVIDATEGGAKIKGTEILTLKEAIDRECAQVEEIDFRGRIEAQPPLFNEEEQKGIRETYIGAEQRLKELEWILKKQIDAYGKLRRMDQKGDNSSKQFQRTVKDIASYTQELEADPLLELIRLYRTRVEFDTLDELNLNPEEGKSEVLSAAKGGEQICETYQKNIDRLKKEWHRLLEENHYI